MSHGDDDGEITKELCTRKVEKRQVGEIAVTDFDLNGVGCEGPLGWRTLILGFVEKMGVISVWAQHRTLCTTDPFFNLGSIRDNLPELNSDGLLRCSGPGRTEIQGNRAFPRLARSRQSTVHRTPEQQSSATGIRGGVVFEEIVEYLVHVSRALGSFIPEIASMTEDFPTLWSPRTQIVGTST